MLQPVASTSGDQPWNENPPPSSIISPLKLITVLECRKDNVPDDEKALYYFYFSQACLGEYDFAGYLEHLKNAIELNPENYKKSLVDAYLLVASH